MNASSAIWRDSIWAGARTLTPAWPPSESARVVASAPPAVDEEPADLPQEAAPAPPFRSSWVAVEPNAVNDERAVGVGFELSGSGEVIGIAVAPAPQPACRASEEWAETARNLAPALLSERWGPLADGRADLVATSIHAVPAAAIPPTPIDDIVAVDADLEGQPPAAATAAPSPLAEVVTTPVAAAEPDAAADVPAFFEAVACALYPQAGDALLRVADQDRSVAEAADGLEDACDPASADSGAEMKPAVAEVAAKMVNAPPEPAASLPWPVFRRLSQRHSP